MSKVPTKVPQPPAQGLQTFQKNSLLPTERRVGAQLPAVREARPLAVAKDSNSMLVAYKDMNSDVEGQLKKQKQQMIFAFALFAFFGVLILVGQVINKPRTLATVSANGELIEGTPTKVERYHYDKTCIRTESGEEVCNTRESRK